MSVPPLGELLKTAEEKLGVSLNGSVQVSTHHLIDDELLGKMTAIDHEKFREDLWYSGEELRERVDKPGFFCLLVSLDSAPIAYDFGYDDAEEGVYFSDTSATIVERRGVGAVLAVLELVYLYESGYRAVKFTTEELDQAGRPLRLIWERMGYRVVSSDPVEGVTMIMDVTREAVAERVERYVVDR
ncbi:hypothetical protein JXL21_15135 [Candidatus Bathyarchaeota archaeon]|nr:hypothetical protein [Candidatus Bathyarchaeota archaeon]